MVHCEQQLLPPNVTELKIYYTAQFNELLFGTEGSGNDVTEAVSGLYDPTRTSSGMQYIDINYEGAFEADLPVYHASLNMSLVMESVNPVMESALLILGPQLLLILFVAIVNKIRWRLNGGAFGKWGRELSQVLVLLGPLAWLLGVMYTNSITMTARQNAADTVGNAATPPVTANDCDAEFEAALNATINKDGEPVEGMGEVDMSMPSYLVSCACAPSPALAPLPNAPRAHVSGSELMGARASCSGVACIGHSAPLASPVA